MEKWIFFTGLSIGRLVRLHIILHSNHQHIMNPGRFRRNQPHAFRQLLTCFNGIVQRISKNGTNVQRFNKISRLKPDLRLEINLQFPGLPQLVTNDNIQKIVSCVVVGFLGFYLFPQLFNRFSHLLGMTVLGLKYQQMVLHIVVNASHPLFFTDLFFYIVKLHLKLPGIVFCL